MVRDEEKYQLATYYRKRGFTYVEIAKLCGVSKSTVSSWLAKKAFSKKVKNDNAARAHKANRKRIELLTKARQGERTKRYQEAERSAVTEYRHYKQDPLFIAALMLYRQAGDQTDPSRIRLTTKDIQSHRIFQKFMVHFLGVERSQFRLWLLLPANASEKTAQIAWSKITKLPLSQFGKTQFLKQTAMPLHNGTGNTIIGSTVLKRKLLKWLELASKELAK